MNIEITLSAPDWMGNSVVDMHRCHNINLRLEQIEESTGLDCNVYCEPSEDNWLKQTSITFIIGDVDRLAVPAMMELVHGLIFEEFDAEFE